MSTGININAGETGEITVQGVKIRVPAPFTEGHVCRANEASVLNQTYAENLRNNMAADIKALKESGASQDDLQKAMDDYVQSYDFGIRASGGTRESLDPVAREALALATIKVKQALVKKGVNLKDFDKDKIKEMAKEAVTAYPQITEIAAQRVALKKSIAEG